MNEAIEKVLPAKWHGWAVAVLAVSPYVSRAYHALASGGGIRGVFSAIWLGTNTPKALKEQVDANTTALVTGDTTQLRKPELTGETNAPTLPRP